MRLAVAQCNARAAAFMERDGCLAPCRLDPAAIHSSTWDYYSCGHSTSQGSTAGRYNDMGGILPLPDLRILVPRLTWEHKRAMGGENKVRRWREGATSEVPIHFLCPHVSRSGENRKMSMDCWVPGKQDQMGFLRISEATMMGGRAANEVG